MIKLLIHVLTDKGEEWEYPLVWVAVPHAGENFWLSFWDGGNIEKVTVDCITHYPENGYIEVHFDGVRDEAFTEIDKTKISDLEGDVPWIHWSIRPDSDQYNWKPISFFRSYGYSA